MDSFIDELRRLVAALPQWLQHMLIDLWKAIVQAYEATRSVFQGQLDEADGHIQLLRLYLIVAIAFALLIGAIAIASKVFQVYWNIREVKALEEANRLKRRGG